MGLVGMLADTAFVRRHQGTFVLDKLENFWHSIKQTKAYRTKNLPRPHI